MDSSGFEAWCPRLLDTNGIPVNRFWSRRVSERSARLQRHSAGTRILVILAMSEASKLRDAQATIAEVRAAAQLLFEAGKVEDASLLMEYAARLEASVARHESDERVA